MCGLCTLGVTGFHSTESLSSASHYQEVVQSLKNAAALAAPLGNQLPITGDGRIDAVTQGSKWGGTNLTYSLWDNVFDIYGDKYKGLSGLLLKWDADKKADVRAAFDTYEAITNLKFTYQETNGAKSLSSDIEIMGTGFLQQLSIGSIGLGVFPDPKFGDQWLQLLNVTRAEYPNVEGSVYLDNFNDVFKHGDPGGKGFWVLLHELGHALGLKHVFDDGGAGRPTLEKLGLSQYDNTVYSIMSYKAVPGSSIERGNAATPMPLDVLALQKLYGANTNYNKTDTVYTLADNGIVKTIWDAGGVDVFDAGKVAKAVMLDLREGQISDIGDTKGAIAYNVVIEHAKGSAFGDTIIGNEAANVIHGNGGADTIYGGQGNDSLIGGQSLADSTDGSDVMYGDKGNDTLLGNAGNDTLYGGSGIADDSDGSDLIYGGFGADVIYGNAGNDSLYGGGALVAPNDSNDLIYGGSGNDQLFGNGGSDTLVGGNGNDTLHGGIGDDVYRIESGAGVDLILLFEGAGVAGGDTLQISSSLNGKNFASAADVIALAQSVSTGIWFDFGGGNSLTIQGISALGAGDVALV